MSTSQSSTPHSTSTSRAVPSPSQIPPPVPNPPEAEATQPQTSSGQRGTPDPDRIKEVTEEAIELDERFLNVLINTKLEFSRQPVEFMGELCIHLTSLPVSRKFRHCTF